MISKQKHSLLLLVIFAVLCGGCDIAPDNKAQQKAEKIVRELTALQVRQTPLIKAADIDPKSSGVRDFVLQLDQSGFPARDKGQWVAFMNVYHEKIGPSIYRATSPDGLSWAIDSHAPAISQRVEGLNDLGTSIGSVIRRSESDYIMFYSGLTQSDNKYYWTFCRAQSKDGKNFTHTDILLRDSAFKGAQYIGLPYTSLTEDGRYVMVCESIVNNAYHIFGAVSTDGYNFTPLNDGNPLLKPGELNWLSGGVANPKLTPVGGGGGTFCWGLTVCQMTNPGAGYLALPGYFQSLKIPVKSNCSPRNHWSNILISRKK